MYRCCGTYRATRSISGASPAHSVHSDVRGPAALLLLLLLLLLTLSLSAAAVAATAAVTTDVTAEDRRWLICNTASCSPPSEPRHPDLSTAATAMSFYFPF
jgi:hypothetical protein